MTQGLGAGESDIMNSCGEWQQNKRGAAVKGSIAKAAVKGSKAKQSRVAAVGSG